MLFSQYMMECQLFGVCVARKGVEKHMFKNYPNKSQPHATRLLQRPQ